MVLMILATTHLLAKGTVHPMFHHLITKPSHLYLLPRTLARTRIILLALELPLSTLLLLVSPLLLELTTLSRALKVLLQLRYDIPQAKSFVPRRSALVTTSATPPSLS